MGQRRAKRSRSREQSLVPSTVTSSKRHKTTGCIVLQPPARLVPQQSCISLVCVRRCEASVRERERESAPPPRHHINQQLCLFERLLGMRGRWRGARLGERWNSLSLTKYKVHRQITSCVTLRTLPSPSSPVLSSLWHDGGEQKGPGEVQQPRPEAGGEV